MAFHNIDFRKRSNDLSVWIMESSSQDRVLQENILQIVADLGKVNIKRLMDSKDKHTVLFRSQLCELVQ